MKTPIEVQMHQLEQMQKIMPNGNIIDADTILVDIIEENDFCLSGFAQDIFTIYQRSNDKKAVKQMFFEFTDMELEEYLKYCFEKLA